MTDSTPLEDRPACEDNVDIQVVAELCRTILAGLSCGEGVMMRFEHKRTKSLYHDCRMFVELADELKGEA